MTRQPCIRRNVSWETCVPAITINMPFLERMKYPCYAQEKGSECYVLHTTDTSIYIYIPPATAARNSD